MAFPAALNSRPLPPVLVAANRPRTGRTLFSLMLADWLGGVLATPCALADADPTRGHLARLSDGTATALAGSRLNGAAANAGRAGALVVDNADALRRGGVPGLGGGDARNFVSLGDWLRDNRTDCPPILCLLIEDGREADGLALDQFRRTLPPGVAAGLVAVRNAGMPPILPTAADQQFAARGGWPASSERQAWLESGARELVFVLPPAALARQAQILGEELRPALGGDPRLWLGSRQQFLHWRRGFGARAARCFGPLFPVPLG